MKSTVASATPSAGCRIYAAKSLPAADGARRASLAKAVSVALVAVALVAGCAEDKKKPSVVPEPTAFVPAGKVALPPVDPNASSANGLDASVPPRSPPTIINGNGEMLAPQAVESSAAAPAEAGDITLNFVDTDVREVVRAVLGDVLRLNYTVDPKVQAMITVQTSRPLQRDQVLPTLQEVLRTGGLALIETGGVYRVLPADDAVRSGITPVVVGAGPTRKIENAAYNMQIFPLRFVAASEMQQTLEPLMPKGALVKADSTRNLLMLSGSGQDLSSVAELVRTFDVDWLQGMSFGIFPLQQGTPKGVVEELNTIFGPGGSVPLSGLVRFQPLDRMNAVLVVSPQRTYLERARVWIDRLDHGAEENTPRLFQYHVQNSRATDLAKVLSQIFSGSQVQTVEPQNGSEGGATQASASGGSGFGGGTMGGGAMGGGALGGGALGGGAGGGMPGMQSTPGLGAGGAPSTPSTIGVGGTTAAAGGGGTGTGTDASRGTGGAGRQGDLASALGNAFGADRAQNDPDMPKVRIVADEKNNALLIYARPRDYRMIQDALQKLDVVPLQVLIEATIAEVTLNDNLQYGLQWFFQQKGNQISLSNGGGSTTATTSVASTATSIAQVIPGFNYAFLSNNVSVVLSALSAVTNVNVVSSPQLLVLDHRVATLQVGDQVPIPTGSAESTLAAGAPIVNTIQYVQTGVILHVSPRVNANGVITLDIVQEVSNATATTTSAINGPTIQQRHIDSTVSVLDGETVALGGLIQDSRTKSNQGLPVLSNIPVVGGLFSTKQDQRQRTELLILLSPRVLHTPAEARAVTDELRSRLHTLEPVVNRIH